MVAQLSCARRPEDPGGQSEPLVTSGLQLQQAVAEARFWEGKCQVLLRELEAAHDVSQVILREYSKALQEKSLETAEWQERFVRTLAEVSKLETALAQSHEDKAATLKQLQENEDVIKKLECDLQKEVARRREGVHRLTVQLEDSRREAQRWKERAERAARDLKDTQERARSAFSTLIEKNTQLSAQCERLQQRPDTKEKAILCVSRRAEVGVQSVAKHRDKGTITLQGSCTTSSLRVNKGTNTTESCEVPLAANSGEVQPENPWPVAEDTAGNRSQRGAGDAAGDLLGLGLPLLTPVNLNGENLLDVSVDRLDELLHPHCNQQQNRPECVQQDQPDSSIEKQRHQDETECGDRPDEQARGIQYQQRDQLEGMLCAVRAQLIRAIRSSQQRQRRWSEATEQGCTEMEEGERREIAVQCCFKSQQTRKEMQLYDSTIDYEQDPVGRPSRSEINSLETSTDESREVHAPKATLTDSCSQTDGSQNTTSRDYGDPEIMHSLRSSQVSEMTKDLGLTKAGMLLERSDIGVQTACNSLSLMAEVIQSQQQPSMTMASQTDRTGVVGVSTQTLVEYSGKKQESERLRETLARERQALAALVGSLRCLPYPHRAVVKRLRQGRGKHTRTAPPAWRKLRNRVLGHIWDRDEVERAVKPVSPMPPPVQQQVSWLRRYLERAAHLRAILSGSQREHVQAQQQHNEFLQRRLQHLIHCSAVTASDLAALRSVHAKLTGHVQDMGSLSSMLPEQGPPIEKPYIKPESYQHGPHENEIQRITLETLKKEKTDVINTSHSCDDIPVKLDREDHPQNRFQHHGNNMVTMFPSESETIPGPPLSDRKHNRSTVKHRPEDEKLWEHVHHVDTTVKRVIRGLRGLPVPATCLMLLRAVPRLARQLAVERKTSGGLSSLSHEAPALGSGRECAARLRAQAQAHQQQLGELRAHHHKYIQALSETHSQAVGRLVEQHAVSLCRAREAVRAELRAELRRDLQRDMRTVLAKSTAVLEQLHQAELTALLGKAVACHVGLWPAGQRAPQTGNDSETPTKAKGNISEHHNAKLHEAGVVAQAATLALQALMSIHSATQDPV